MILGATMLSICHKSTLKLTSQDHNVSISNYAMLIKMTLFQDIKHIERWRMNKTSSITFFPINVIHHDNKGQSDLKRKSRPNLGWNQNYQITKGHIHINICPKIGLGW